jgi:nitrate/nitrite-specific signal transduction histidine kinase
MRTLVQMCQALNASHERWAGYVQAVGIMQRALGARLAPSFLLDTSRERALLVTDEAQRAVLGRDWPWIPTKLHVREPWLDTTGWPVSARDHLDSEAWRELPPDFRAWLGTSGVVVQVQADGRHLGAVLMSFDHEFELDQDTAEFLAAAGHILGRAIHSGVLAQRQQELGSLKERRLLADELHVDLAQQVAALGLHAASMRLDFDDGDRAQLKTDIDALTEMLTHLKATLRHEMLALRTDWHTATDSCMEAIQAQVQAFERLAPLQVTVECLSPDQTTPVPLEITAQLTRVLQEALSNALLHSAASRVTVRLTTSSRRARLEIEDDGHGFEPYAVADTRLGMVIMQERMAQVDGSLTVRSSAGRGTVVIAEAPFGQQPGWIALGERIGALS